MKENYPEYMQLDDELSPTEKIINLYIDLIDQCKGKKEKLIVKRVLESYAKSQGVQIEFVQNGSDVASKQNNPPKSIK